MPPKFKPKEIKVVYLRFTRVPWVCLQKNVGDDIAKVPSDWKSLRIMVKLTIQNRQAQMRWCPLPLPGPI
ncbi:hypothetical protein A6R68_11685 [Neotoma lepida]|uniref:Uncharacterized protein n=1 Tax=Neotoma lepida TaxID=56216 RepID=A0A1A6FVP1_NEOLE|nr:hypothetical protein A6R68_11685 [Neotoma lepida]